VSDEWFRNTEWNAQIATRFHDKLCRARRKEQYIRIQAGMLARTHPEVALELLDLYFTLPDDFDHAQGHADRARALSALGDPEAAVASYEDALMREAEFPQLRTQACLELPFLIATTPLQDHYERALQVLAERRDQLTFPVDQFRWNVAKALIHAARGDRDVAQTCAMAALDAAGAESSGFRYHKLLGLVGDELAPWVETMTEIAVDR
jgi:tetratricopeptide (TPR) repeat protein